MKVTVRYEALNARDESTSKTFDIDSGELALMIEIDRHERAKQAQEDLYVWRWLRGASRVPIAVDPPLVVGSDARDRP